MSCSIKNRLITSIKQDIKQNATSYQFEDAKVFIPFNPNSKYVKTLDQAVQLATEKVLKINNKYKIWSKGDIVSLDTTPTDGVYINVHPTQSLIDSYEIEEERKAAEKADGRTYFSNKINYTLKSVNILMSDKAKQVFTKGEKANWDLNKILTELQIPREQKELILNLGKTDREQIALELAANYSYSVEINTTKEQGLKNQKKGFDLTQVPDTGRWVVSNFQTGIPKYFDIKEDAEKYIKGEVEETPTQHYSNMTVPGGTNYTENEISTPLITPSIKGHAQFSTDNGIGWFRSDDKIEFLDKEDLIKKGIIKQVPCG